MTQVKEVYRILNPFDWADAANQTNGLLLRIAERLDAIEGYRETSEFQVGANFRGDLTVIGGDYGLVVSNADATITKRIRLNDAGDDIIIEDI